MPKSNSLTSMSSLKHSGHMLSSPADPAGVLAARRPPPRIAHTDGLRRNDYLDQLIAGHAVLHQDVHHGPLSRDTDPGRESVAGGRLDRQLFSKPPVCEERVPAGAFPLAQAQEHAGRDHREVGQFRELCQAGVGGPLVPKARGIHRHLRGAMPVV